MVMLDPGDIKGKTVGMREHHVAGGSSAANAEAANM
jgi:hypothetical protein